MKPELEHPHLGAKLGAARGCVLAVACVCTRRPGQLGSVVSHTGSYCLQILRSYSLLLLLPPSCAAIGSYQFFALTFRKQEAEQMLLVTDRLGRIRHATSSLAQLLDTTVDRMIVRGGGIHSLGDVVESQVSSEGIDSLDAGCHC